jgi:hypothetical protein
MPVYPGASSRTSRQWRLRQPGTAQKTIDGREPEAGRRQIVKAGRS